MHSHSHTHTQTNTHNPTHTQLVWDAPPGSSLVHDALRVLLRSLLANSSTATMLLKWLRGDFNGARDAALRGFAPALQTRLVMERTCHK